MQFRREFHNHEVQKLSYLVCITYLGQDREASQKDKNNSQTQPYWYPKPYLDVLQAYNVNKTDLMCLEYLRFVHPIRAPL